MRGGVATAVVTQLLGTAVIWGIAGSSAVCVPEDRRLLIVNENPIYQQAYLSGFTEKLRSRRKSVALKGGLLGTAAFLVIYVSVAGGPE